MHGVVLHLAHLLGRGHALHVDRRLAVAIGLNAIHDSRFLSEYAPYCVVYQSLELAVEYLKEVI